MTLSSNNPNFTLKTLQKKSARKLLYLSRDEIATFSLFLWSNGTDKREFQIFVHDTPDYHIQASIRVRKVNSNSVAKLTIDNWLTNFDVKLLVAIVTISFTHSLTSRHHINKFVRIFVLFFGFLCVYFYIHM